MPNITIGLIKATLLKLFHYHSPLNLQTAFTEIEAQHSIRFKPKSGFHILSGYSEVIIGNVIIGPGIIFPSCQL